MKRHDVIITAIGCAIVVLTITLSRWLGPGDLYEKDQPKTIAYTADIVLNAHWALPRDVIYQPATKPPVYNWIGAAAVWATGSWSEWVLKFPSVLGTFITAIVVFAASLYLSWHGRSARDVLNEQNTGETPVPRRAGLLLALLAVAVWFTFGSDVRHGSVMRLSYLARPDMLQAAFLSVAWFAAWVAIDKPNRKKSVVPAMVFWFSVTLAALTKGPAAVMPIAFAVVYAILQPNRLQRLSKLWWEIGIPLVVIGVGAWLYTAYQHDPQHVRQTILGAEIADRVTNETPEGFAKPVYYSLMWFVTKAMPWGAMAIIACACLAIARCGMGVPPMNVSNDSTRAGRPSHTALVSVALYLIVIIVLLSIPAGKRMDYLLPSFAPAAILVAWLMMSIMTRLKLPAWLPILIPILLAINLSHRHLTRFHEAKSHYTDRATAFVNEVRSHVPARERLIVIVRGKHPLPTLLGLHQGSYLTRKSFVGPVFVVMPEQKDLSAVVMSAPLPIGFDDIEDRAVSRVGLYYFAAGDVPVDRLVALQKQVGTWTRTENPYHAPGTVYRE